MSYFGETPSVENELKKLRKELNQIKVQAEFQPVTQVGHSTGEGVGGGTTSISNDHLFKLQPVVHNIKRKVTDKEGNSKSGNFNKIFLTSSCVLVDKGLSTDSVGGGAHSPTNYQLELMTIQGAIGQDADSDTSNVTTKMHDGQIVYIKPRSIYDNSNGNRLGYSLTLKAKTSTEGNIDIANDVTINSDEFAILQWHEDAHATDGHGYFLLLRGGGGSSSSGSNTIKQPCRVATTGNNTNPLLIGTQVDGVTIIAGDRVLYKNQTDQEDNGIYVCKSVASIFGTMERAEDFDQDAEVLAGVQVAIEEGTVHADEVWKLTTNNPIVVGTTDLTWSKISGMEWSTPVDASIIPDTDITYNLGSNTKHFTNTFTNIIQLGNDTALSDTDTIGSVNFSGKDDGSNGYVNDWASIKSIVDDATSTNKTAHLELRQYDSNTIKTMLKTDQFGIYLSNDAGTSQSPSINGSIWRSVKDVKVRTDDAEFNLTVAKDFFSNKIWDTGIAGTCKIQDVGYNSGTDVATFGRTTGVDFYGDLDMHTYDIGGIDILRFHTGTGTADVLGTNDIGIESGSTGSSSSLGMKLNVGTDQGYFFRVANSTKMIINDATDKKIQAYTDLVMNSSSNVIGSGAGKGMTNIGELHFINNTATPSGNGVMYFDGTDLKVKSGSAVRNLSQINSNTATRELDNLQNVALNTDIGMNGNSITGIEHIKLGTASSSPTDHGSIYASSTQVYIRIGSNTYTVSSFARELEELSDVTIGTPSANTVLKWDSGSSQWVDGNIMNVNIDSGANIDQSKLNLAITNSEVSTGTFASITGIGTQSQNLNMNTKTIQNVERMDFSTYSATPSSNGVLFYDGTDLKARVGGSTVNLTSGSGSSWVGTATSDLDMNGNHIKNTTNSNGGHVTFEDNIDMRTYNIEGIDQLIFSNATNSNDPVWNTSNYGLQIEGGTSDTGLDIRVPSGKLIKLKTGNVTELQINGSTGTLDVNSNKITSLGTPSSDYDASTKKYVDDEIAGISSGGAIQRYQLYNSTSSNSELEMWHCSSHTYGSNGDGMSMQTLTQYKIYWQPLMIPVACKLQFVGLWSDGNNYSNGKYDVGLYSNGGSGSNANLLYPYQRLEQETDVFSHNEAMSDVETAGDWNYSLSAGLYWLAVLPVGTDVTCANIAPKWMQSMGFYYESPSSGKNDSPVTSGATVGYYKTGQTSLPATAPDELDRRYSAQTGWEPAIFCRFKS